MNGQDSAEGTAGGYALTSQGIVVHFRAEMEINFTLHHIVETPPAFYSTGNDNSFPGNKAAVA